MEGAAEILKSVGAVAGLGGLAIGLALVIFREIIRRNIFPKISRDHAFIIIMTIAVLTWSISVFALYVYWQPQPVNTARAPADHFKFIDNRLYCSRADVLNPTLAYRDNLSIAIGDCSDQSWTYFHYDVDIAGLGLPVATGFEIGDYYQCATFNVEPVRDKLEPDIRKLFAEYERACISPAFYQFTSMVNLEYTNFFDNPAVRYFEQTLDMYGEIESDRTFAGAFESDHTVITLDSTRAAQLKSAIEQAQSETVTKDPSLLDFLE